MHYTRPDPLDYNRASLAINPVLLQSPDSFITHVRDLKDKKET